MTRSVETFVPIDPNCVTMYVCGPTVYAAPHIGNARPAVIFDLLHRLLALEYPNVVYTRNFTDVDDKIINRAKITGTTIKSLCDKTIIQYRDLMQWIGCQEPTYQPRATDHITDMIAMITVLIEKKHAYVSEGHVLFDISSYTDHGALSRHDQDDLKNGARVEVASYKRDPADFVLWKPSHIKIGWDSPWGFGRPGWHIECSAMIKAIFKSTIDIHCGGADLRFPHHDCEISQSQCANDYPLANVWVHNSMVLVDRKKMAKSTGNIVLMDDLRTFGKISGDAVRLALMQTHYRSPLNWTLEVSRNASEKARAWFGGLLPYIDEIAARGAPRGPSVDLIAPLKDDLNTPLFIATIDAAFKELDTVERAIEIASTLAFAGLFEDFFSQTSMTKEEQVLFDAREIARKEKKFGLADQLRDLLKERGILLKDAADRTMWWRTPI